MVYYNNTDGVPNPTNSQPSYSYNATGTVSENGTEMAPLNNQSDPTTQYPHQPSSSTTFPSGPVPYLETPQALTTSIQPQPQVQFEPYTSVGINENQTSFNIEEDNKPIGAEWPSPPRHDAASPQYPYIRGIVDLTNSRRLISNVPREVLRNTPQPDYTYEEFKKDKALPCRDLILASFGIIGPIIAVAAIVLEIADIGLSGIAAASVPGFILMIIYYFAFCLCTKQCCCCCDGGWDQACLSGKYYTAVYKRKNYEIASVDAITIINQVVDHIQHDVPHIRFDIVCSHSRKQGKRSVRIVTYRGTQIMPIIHFRRVGLDGKEFMKRLDQYTNGEVAVDFQPELILHPQQRDYIGKFARMVYQWNKARDTDCRVTATIDGHNSKNTSPYLTAAHGKYHSRNFAFSTYSPDDYNNLDVLRHDDDIDRESSYRRPNEPDVDNTNKNFKCQASSSVGGFSTIYYANSMKKNCCLRCLTHPFFWCLGTNFGCACCCLGLWKCRYNRAAYHNKYYILFPQFDEMVGAYVREMHNFSPTSFGVQQPLMADEGT